MNVSTYIEAFLTVYGWEVYGALFLLLMMTGLFIYPLLRAFIEIAIDFLGSDGQEGQNALFQIITSTVLALAIFIVALVPVAEISFSKMTVANHCGKAQFAINDVNKEVLGEYFTDTDARVPLMPWLAMSIAQGVNSVFYKNLPCVQDVTEAQNYVLTLDLSDANNPAEIRKEYKRFNNECHAKVRKIIEDVRNGNFDNALGSEEKIHQKWLNDKTKNEVIKLREQRSGGWDFWGWFIDSDENKFMLEFTDSPLIQNEFYKYETSSAPEELKKTLVTLRAEHPVEGYNGSTIANNETATPTCYEWWNGANGSEGLRSKILKASNKNIVRKAASALGPAACRIEEQLEMAKRSAGQFYNEKLHNSQLSKSEEECQQYIQSAITGSNKELFNTYMLFVQHANHLKDSPLTDDETGALTASAILEGVGIAISAITKKDLGTGMLSTVTSFYATALLIKIMLKYLIPFALMTIYMFWGIYMVIGGLRGTTMLKGMFIIIALCIVPGLWVVIDHLDDHLWAAMGMSEWGIFNRAMLDITTGMFYFGILYVVFFIFNLAGGGDASAAVRNSGGGMSDGLARSLGGSFGRGSGKVGSWSVFGSEKPQTNKETNRREMVPTGGFIGKGIGAGLGKIGSYGKRAWSGIRNGWSKWRGR